jgi:hypothetical protein
MEEGNLLDLKMLMVVDMGVNLLDLMMLMEEGMVVSPPDRRTPTGEAMVDGHLDLTMLMDLGDQEDGGISK